MTDARESAARAILRAAVKEAHGFESVHRDHEATLVAAMLEFADREREACAKAAEDEAARIRSLFADEQGMTDMRVACEMKCDSLAAAIRNTDFTKGVEG